MDLLTIIFSKDRAAQLDLLLYSIGQKDHFEALEYICVIYKTSNPFFEHGYSKVSDSYPNVQFYPEESFKKDILDIINACKPKHIMFLVDDMIMMHELMFDLNDGFRLLETQPVCTITLRLGMNTTWQYQINRPTIMPQATRKIYDLLVWNRTTIPSTMNFNYPFSVDGHIFRSDLIVPIIEETHFTFPNNFEGGLQAHVYKAPPLMACQHTSAFVNTPINRVQDIYPNRVGDTYTISPELLNQKFLEGNHIDYEAIDFSTVRGCHNELLLQIVPDKDL